MKNNQAEYEYHLPIMPEECISYLKPSEGKLIFDGTLGGGGHSQLILNQGAQVLAADKDADAIRFVSEKFGKVDAFEGRYMLVKDDFKNVLNILESKGIKNLDGALLDLGISSHHIDEPKRGFSYMKDGPLDMRMDQSAALSAEVIVNEYPEDEIRKILFRYAEERFAGRIAAEICRMRTEHRITTTLELAKLCEKCVPMGARNGHAAKKTFQALRIAVNCELDGLESALKDIVSVLKSGAVFAVITFHSLEDRIVKQTFKEFSLGCICDKSLPVCVCGHTPEAILPHPKGIKPGEEETNKNSRSKSAILRVLQKL